MYGDTKTKSERTAKSPRPSEGISKMHSSFHESSKKKAMHEALTSKKEGKQMFKTKRFGRTQDDLKDKEKDQ